MVYTGKYSVAAFVFASLIPAQAIVVDPGGGGQFTDLQAAIDAAPNGGLIEVRAGSYPNIVITGKSLSLFGVGQPLIQAPADGIGTQPASIAIQGTGSEIVRLADLAIGGSVTSGVGWNRVGAGIDAADTAALKVFDCVVEAGHYVNPTGVALGASAVRVQGPSRVVLVGGSYRASFSDPTGGSSMPRPGLPNGAAGIDAPAATVETVATQVHGGSVFSVSIAAGLEPPSPCACPSLGANGGDAVVAAVLRETGTRLVPGQGANVLVVTYGTGGGSQPYGQQPSGLEFRGGVRERYSASITEASPPRLGQTWHLDIRGGRPGTFQALGIGLDSGNPLRLANGWVVFLEASAPILWLSVSPTATVLLRTPNKPGLLGADLTAQIFALGGQSSGPLYTIVRP